MKWDTILKARKPSELYDSWDRSEGQRSLKARKIPPQVEVRDYGEYDSSDEPKDNVMRQTRIHDKLDVYTDDSCRDELKNYLDKVSRHDMEIFSEVLLRVADDYYEENKEKSFLESYPSPPNMKRYITNRDYTDDLPEQIACIALRKIKVTPIGKKEVLGPLDENGDPWKAETARPAPFDEERRKSLKPSDQTPTLRNEGFDSTFESYLKTAWNNPVLWEEHNRQKPFDITIAMEAAGSWNKLKALVRPWEKEILVNIKKEFDAQKKPSARPRGESYVDGKYYIVRYYKWMKSRNDGTDMYVNTLNIRKGDKVLFKVGYVINTNLTLNPEDKIKFDKEADWRS
tara:strand:+ start:69 stop:1097 length:1029 start_codon:yes stop_codon:yes gene_type:complete